MAKVTPLRTKAADIKPVLPMQRTAEGVRNLLFEEIDKLRDGTGDRRRAQTIAQLVGAIINVTKVEIDYQRHIALIGRDLTGIPQQKMDEATRLGTLKLGSDIK